MTDQPKTSIDTGLTDLELDAVSGGSPSGAPFRASVPRSGPSQTHLVNSITSQPEVLYDPR